MTRTADRAAAVGIGTLIGMDEGDPALHRWASALNDRVAEALDGSTPIVVADNVAAYLRGNDLKGWVLEDLPCLVPPWPAFWIESDRLTPGSRQRQAFWIMRFDLREEESRPGWVDKAIDDALANGADDDELRFGVMLLDYVEDRKRVLGPLSVVALALDHLGRCRGNHWMHLGSPDQDAPEVRLFASMTTALQTIAFMHCKNVVSEVVRPEPKLARAYRKRHGRELLDYRTVRLVVPRKATDSRSSGAGTRHALHIASGHMAHYGNCCPGVHEPKGLLFGKREGIYWIPDHMRGDPELGRTRRDYDVVVRPDG